MYRSNELPRATDNFYRDMSQAVVEVSDTVIRNAPAGPLPASASSSSSSSDTDEARIHGDLDVSHPGVSVAEASSPNGSRLSAPQQFMPSSKAARAHVRQVDLNGNVLGPERVVGPEIDAEEVGLDGLIACG